MAKISKIRRYEFENLKKKGLTVSIPIFKVNEFGRLLKLNPDIPITPVKIRQLSKALFPPLGKRGLGSSQLKLTKFRIIDLTEECREEALGLLFDALKNPAIEDKERDLVDADMDASIPEFENQIETKHFILKWTNTNGTTNDRISDEGIIKETGKDLERAWRKYNIKFGKSPYVTPGTTKIEVIFYYIGPTSYGSTHPNLPISFNSRIWKENPGIRKPVSAHELFHRLQYSFGYRTNPSAERGGWFSEGTASWAETYMWNMVSRQEKITNVYTNPDQAFYNLSYNTCPFWIFFQKRLNKMRSFLEEYGTSGRLKDSLSRVIRASFPPHGVFGELDNFFTLWHRGRCTGEDALTGITGPGGSRITPVLNITDFTISTVSPSYRKTTDVAAHGADYYRFALDPSVDGRQITITLDGEAPGDFAYQFIWFKDGGWRKAAFPSSASLDYGYTEKISLDISNKIVVVAAGKKTGGRYTINVEVA